MLYIQRRVHIAKKEALQAEKYAPPDDRKLKFFIDRVLTKREAYVLSSLWGLGQKRENTYKEASLHLKKSEDTIADIYKSALKKLEKEEYVECYQKINFYKKN